MARLGYLNKRIFVMIKRILSIVLLICVTLSAGAEMTKCIITRPTPNTTTFAFSCDRPSVSELTRGTPDWDVTCHFSSDGINVQDITFYGVGTCSDTEPNVSTAESLQNYQLSTMGLSALYCWCRILIPFVTQWFPYSTSQTEQTFGYHPKCMANCSQYCAQAFATNKALQNTLFMKNRDFQ